MKLENIIVYGIKDYNTFFKIANYLADHFKTRRINNDPELNEYLESKDGVAISTDQKTGGKYLTYYCHTKYYQENNYSKRTFIYYKDFLSMTSNENREETINKPKKSLFLVNL